MATESATVRRRPADTGRRLQALTDISRLISLGLDSQAIGAHTAAAIARLLDSPYARLWQLDPSNGDLVLVAGAGRLSDAADIGRRRPVSLNTLNHRVLAGGRIFQSGDISAERGINRAVQRLGLKTYVGVPLAVGDRKYGVLAIRFYDERTVGQADLELVEAIASQAAIALHNAASYDQTRRHEERLKTLADFTRLINSTLEPDAVLQAAARAARQLLNSRLSSVWIYDGSTQLLELRAHDPPERRSPIRTLTMDDSMAGWALQLGKPYISHDVGHHPLWKGSETSDLEARSAAIVPFYDHEQPLGVLVTLGEREQSFDEQDLQLLDALAAQVAVAVLNARHYAAARDLAHQLSTLMRANRHLTLGRRPEEILDNIAEDAAKLLDAEAAGIRLVEDGNLVHVSSYGAEAALVVRASHPLDEGLTGEVVRLNAPVQTTDLWSDERSDPRHRELAGRLGFRGWLGVPLQGRTAVVGVLTVLRQQQQAFTEAQIELLMAFANQSAVAIENARLYAHQQSVQHQLEAIRELSSGLSQQLDLDRMLDLATLGAVELLRAAFGALYLWDESSNLLRRCSANGRAQDFPVSAVRLGEGVTGAAGRQRSSVIVNDYASSELALAAVLSHGSAHAAMAEPILYQDRLLGVITLGHDSPTGQFSQEDGQLLSIFAGQVAIAIENCRLFKQAARAEALDELARLKTEFLNTVSHELRTPLSLIHGYSELLIARAERLSGPEVQQMSRAIHTGSRTMAQLVDNLLDFSRLEQDRMELHRVAVSLTNTVNDGVDEFCGSDARTRITATVQEDMHGSVDPDRLKQVVSALLANAARFAPDGSIALHSDLSDGIFQIRVTDDGPGVPEDEQLRVWEKFFRGAAAVNSPVRGSGLGLALVKHIVSLHGGSVGVSSTPGQGATFWIRVPVEPDA
ncbi:MAG TPA: GAF domain-containing protein [Chloroflexota bacterium]|nr:GAF domain-containing protein [Chloroflexota bacterium]